MAVKIGYEGVEINNVPVNKPLEVGEVTEEKKEEIKRIFKKKEVYIPPDKIDEILKNFDCVVVHSFGKNDDYHLSEKERAERNEYYSIAKVLRRQKNIIRKLPEYIKAVRNVMAAINKIAETNNIYDPEEFKKLYYKGEIIIEGIRFPKYKGKDRKKLSWDYVIDFIMSDKDPDSIKSGLTGEMSEYDDLPEEERRRIYYSDEEWKNVNTPLSDEETKYEVEAFDKDEDKQGKTNTVVPISRKKSNKIIKEIPGLSTMVKELDRRSKFNSSIRSAVFTDSVYDDIAELEKYDGKHKYKSDSDAPVFHGDILSSSDYDKYMYELDEWEGEHTYVNVNGKMVTKNKADEIALKDILEAANWNLIKLESNAVDKTKLKKNIHGYEKKQKKIKAKLMALRERKYRRDSDEDVDKKIKNLKKKRKFNKDKVAKLENELEKKKKKNKKHKEIVENATKHIEGTLVVNSGKSDFDEWENEALDFRSIFDN